MFLKNGDKCLVDGIEFTLETYDESRPTEEVFLTTSESNTSGTDSDLETGEYTYVHLRRKDDERALMPREELITIIARKEYIIG